MQATILSLYRCCRCAREIQSQAWMGRCPSCGTINSMRLVEGAVVGEAPAPRRVLPSRRAWPQAVPFAPRVRLDEDDGEDGEDDEDLDDDMPEDDEPEDILTIEGERIPRTPCGHLSIDDVITNGGMPNYGAIMFAAPPGTGKSRITTEIAARRASQGRRALVISGEEQKAMIGQRFQELDLASRFDIPRGHFQVYLTNDLERAMRRIDDTDADDVYLDAMNVMRSRSITARSEHLQLIHIARILHSRAWASVGTEYEGKKKVMIWAICHGTKDGDMAGPEKAKHLVDAAFMLDHADPTGGPAQDQRRPTGYLRFGCLAKNRFGASDVTRYMQMTKPNGILVPYEPVPARKE